MPKYEEHDSKGSTSYTLVSRIRSLVPRYIEPASPREQLRTLPGFLAMIVIVALVGLFAVETHGVIGVVLGAVLFCIAAWLIFIGIRGFIVAVRHARRNGGPS